jgi:hypothetical protein
MRWRSHLAVIGIVLAAFGVAMLGDLLSASKEFSTPSGSEEILVVPARSTEQTLVAYQNRGMPPWPKGNCFALVVDPQSRDAPRFQVVNMHAENFGRIVRDLGIETVEIRKLGDRHCLITDTRIPREWFLEKPCELCTPVSIRENLKENHSEYFRR